VTLSISIVSRYGSSLSSRPETTSTVLCSNAMTIDVGQPVPAKLGEARVVDRHGESSTLGERWADGPAVVVFLRHFACVACSEHVAQLAPRLHELTRLGLRVAYVGNGAENFLQGFIERNEIDTDAVEVVTDPSLRAHRALDLERSTVSTYGPAALLHIGRALLRGFRQTRIEGDNLQQGGVLVVDGDGDVAYLHRDRHTGDHAPTGDVIDAAMGAAALAARPKA
jgi:peroxiredoxin